jgi:hypothetical protein
VKPGEGRGDVQYAHPSPLPQELGAGTGPPAHSPSPGSVDPPPELRPASGVPQENIG